MADPQTDKAPDGETKEVRDLVLYGRILDRDKRRLKVKLTAEEVRAASRRMGQLMRERRRGDVLDTETQDRDVECVTKINWEDGTAETVRCDTQEILTTRSLTDAERQEELFRRDPNKRRGRGRRGE